MAELFPGLGEDDGRVGLSSGLSQNRERVDVVEKSLERVRPDSTKNPPPPREAVGWLLGFPYQELHLPCLGLLLCTVMWRGKNQLPGPQRSHQLLEQSLMLGGLYSRCQ